MNVLGIHSMGHDTGLCYFAGDRLVFAIETERLTRCRHDHRVDVALRYFTEELGYRTSDVDLVALSTNVRPSLMHVRDLDAASEAIGRGQLHVETTCDGLGSTINCLIVAHEAGHAQLACHYQPIDRCLAFVNEGKGTFSRNSLFLREHGMLRLVDADALPWYGTGFGWSALGFAFGFGLGPGVAGTLMALCGYSGPSDVWRDLLLAIPERCQDAPRAAQERALDTLVSDPRFGRGFDDMSAAFSTLQDLFAGAVEDYLADRLRRHGVDAALALGGGCALNVLLNARLRSRLTPAIAIPPACNDAGQALGAALYALAINGVTPAPFDVCSNGVAVSAGDALASMDHAGLDAVPFDPAAVATVLARGGVVAWMRGRAELGPRALGHRSLLASPAVPGMKQRVSERLKGRQSFRPLSPVMTLSAFRDAFGGAPESPHMLFTYAVADPRLAEAIHVDGTARIQTLAPDANPALHAVLCEFESRTGVPGLINTSLNAHNRAMAYTPADVLQDFAPGDVDLFVFDDAMAYAPALPRAAVS